MKKVFTFLLALLLTVSVFLPQQLSAQAPEKMSFQAVVRNSSDALVTNTSVGIQVSILQGSASGTAVYVETQTPTTNANGLISIEIGNGTVVSGDFTTINWANGPNFIKTETDPAGGTSYSITGTSQLLSVPYALHAKTAETVTGTITETDPVYGASQAAKITSSDVGNLGNLSGTNTGDQNLSALATKTALGDSTAQVRSEIPDVSGFVTSETDPVYRASQAAKITSSDIGNLGNLSGTNTGDQNLSALATKTALGDSTAQVRSEIPDVSGFVTNETDPVYGASQAAKITSSDIGNLGNLSGTNTGDQNLSALATKTALGDSTAQVRSEIPDVSGFLSSESDPVYGVSVASGITGADTAYWNSKQDELGDYIATQNINLNGYYISNDGTNEGISISSTNGDVTTSNDLKVTGEVNRPSTGSANMIPIAYGNVDSDGSVNTGSGNISVVWSSTNSRYEITISNEAYSYLTYITMVTPITGGISATTSSVSGKLLVKIFDASGNQVQGIFQFVTFKP